MEKTYRIGVAGIYHETNTFAPGKTTMKDFKAKLIQDEESFLIKYKNTRTSMGGAIDGAKEHNVELLPGLYTEATPSGIVTGSTIESLIDMLVDSLDDNLDGILLFLHGAMVSETYFDVEAEILSRLRKKYGNELPIAVTLDLHANISKELVDLSSFIVGYDTYPHIDAYERAVEAMDILYETISGAVNPVMAIHSPRMLVAPQAMITDKGPMKKLLDFAHKIEENPSILNVTVAGGFPFSDVPDVGMTFTVTADGDMELAQKSAKQLSELAWKLRDQFVVKEVDVEQAIKTTVQLEEQPVIWVEGSDNVGGGSPADATHVLKDLINLELTSLIVIRDEEIAQLAHELGVGSELNCKIGGKSDELHGDPVHINGKIIKLSDGKFKYVGAYMTGKEEYMGKTAVVKCNRVTIVITENRVPPFDINHVKSLGINPEEYKIIVVKSAIAWKTAFGDIAKDEIYLDTPGCCSSNLFHFDYKNVKKPIYPLDR